MQGELESSPVCIQGPGKDDRFRQALRKSEMMEGRQRSIMTSRSKPGPTWSAVPGIWLVLALCLLVAGCTPESTSLPERIPLDALFGNPKKSNPRISPDASMVAYLAPVRNVLNVWIGPAGGTGYRPVTRDTLQGIRSYFWASDSRHILYFQDKSGDENWHLFAVNINTGEERDLTPFDNVTAGLVGRDDGHPDLVLISLNRDDVSLHDVYRLEVSTGKLEKAADNPGDIAGWVPDPDLRVRGALRGRDDGGFDFLVRERETAPWRPLVSWTSDEIINSGIVGFTREGNSVYLLDSRFSNTARLIRMDVNTAEYEVLAEDSLYDVIHVGVDPITEKAQVAVIAAERDSLVVLDESIREDVEAVKRLHRGDPYMASRASRDSVWIIGFSSDDEPPPYYLYDRRTKQATFLFYQQPELKDYSLATMEPISFTARDGLEIHGYMTFPPGRVRRGLPMVVNVHGGPWTRDYWGFDTEAQWLANRGYICMQVNFRGSTGYGKEFLNAGNREWGGKMQTDLADAVRWAIEQGYAAPDEVGIMGYSYGGYAALSGVAFTPESYVCAVSIAAPPDLLSLVRSFPPHWSAAYDLWYNKVGHPIEDSMFLKSRSPLYHTDSIHAPVMIAHGANDVRVSQKSVDLFVRKLRERDVPVEYLMLPDEGHGISRPENRIKIYAQAEQFLARYLSE